METADLQTRSFRIDGMACINCQNRIEKKLKSTAGVQDASVSYETGTATVSYNAPAVTLSGIILAVESLGYKVVQGKETNRISRIAGTLAIIVVLYMLLRMFSTDGIAAAFPTVQAGMGYGMLLVIGLLTSVHCIGMCGGINLSQTLRKDKKEYFVPDHSGLLTRQDNGQQSFSHFCFLIPVFPAILYNSGRLVSYTAIGVAVGALGQVFTVSGRFQGMAQLIAGIFMLIMGINMLGLFPALRRFVPRMSAFPQKKVNGQKIGRGPLVVGILNGFMPCGPLQAMQLYALSTGSPIRGGISMFLFCLGTIPLMFALGAASGILSGAKGQAFSRKVMRGGAVLVAAMGLIMFSNGWSLAGLTSPVDRVAVYVNPASLNAEGGAFAPNIQNGIQIVNSTLLANRYPAVVVRQGIPVRWIINAPPGSINSCNSRMIIREYGVEHTFSRGDNIIEFLPAKTGRFSYSCWMGMIRSSITVVAEGESFIDVPEPDATPKPAGVGIPAEKIVLADVLENYQMVEIMLTGDGFEPAIVVMQRRLPALWNIRIDSLDPGNEGLIFPVYFAVLKTEQGDNSIQLIPTDDFEFSTGDNVFFGYVKVVDDINNVDIEAIKAEVGEYETLIYPEAYFEAVAGGCCCG